LCGCLIFGDKNPCLLSEQGGSSIFCLCRIREYSCFVMSLLLSWLFKYFCLRSKVARRGTVNRHTAFIQKFFAITLKSENLLPLYNTDRHPPLPE
jgi:uncharacterized membrane protein